MNAVTPKGADAFLRRYEGLRGRLPGAGDDRQAAADLLRQRGLPHVGEEDWRYTNLRPVFETGFYEALVDLGDRGTVDEAALLAQLPDLDMPRLVFLNGRFLSAASNLPAQASFSTFADNPQPVEAARTEPLAALNTMLAEDGACLHVRAGIDAGAVLLVSLAAELPGHAMAFHPRHRIHVDAGATLTVFEIALGRGRYLHNPVIDIVVAEDATLTHIRLQDEATEAFHLATLYAEIGAAATYDSFLLTLGARLARVEVHAKLHGAGGTVHLNGAQLLSGAQHADFTTIVAHDAPLCASRQTVKNVLAGKSRGVFQGKIEVARAAQKTDGYQMNQALLLSPDAEMDSKPQLEIYADDVRCSHGATIGQLDPDQIFYLRSRGVGEPEARAILVRAFLAEALDPIANDSIRAVLEAALDRWWTRQAA